VEEKTLELKYRPNKIEDVFGQEETKKALQKLLQRKTGVPKSYLFHGDRGCGKTTFSRLIAKELGVSGLDYKEVDMADKTGVENMRSIIESAHCSPNKSPYRIFMLDEVHQVSKSSMNALLKTLEDPPKKTIFILSTTDPERLLKTIVSRCHSFHIKPLKMKEMGKLLMHICKQEGIKTTNKVLKAIAMNTEGIPREALKLLDMVRDCDSEEEGIALASNAIVGENTAGIEICKQILDNQPWKTLSETLKSIEKDTDYAILRRAMLNYIKKVLHDKENEKLFDLYDILCDEPFYYVPQHKLFRAVYSLYH